MLGSPTLVEQEDSALDDEQPQEQQKQQQQQGSEQLVVSCPICFQALRDPFLTPCGHCFCYSCITTHLRHRKNCPCCLERLSADLIYPNVVLDKALRRLSFLESLDRASPAQYLQQAFQDAELSLDEIDELLEILRKQRKEVLKEDAESNMNILHDCLQQWLLEREKSLGEVQDDLKSLELDINFLKREKNELRAMKQSYLSKFNERATSEVGTSTSITERKKKIVESAYESLRACYVNRCRHFKNHEGEEGALDRHAALEDFRSIFLGFCRYRNLQVVNEMHLCTHLPTIISSIEFDRNDEYFATAGVSGSLKIFKFSENPWKANMEVATKSKLSCLSWDNFDSNYIACSDYDGVIRIWDVSTSQNVVKLEEHEKRVWSVDFSQMEPSLLLSGSDDGKVKVWSRTVRSSTMTIETGANICSVKYNPGSSNLIAAGSADHSIYYYDLRQTMTPLHVFEGHSKAVSYVKFTSSTELVSASTDSTLRLWNLQDNSCVQKFRGHTNEKNFVGLAVFGDHIACGSELNEVFVYHKGIEAPAICHKYPVLYDDEVPFISGICWKRKDSVLLAANSQGTIRALRMVP